MGAVSATEEEVVRVGVVVCSWLAICLRFDVISTELVVFLGGGV